MTERQTTCPSCRAEMEPMALERTAGGPLTLDVCHVCSGLWFDTGEHLRLTADATLTLIRAVHARRTERRRPLGTRFSCPTCGTALGRTYDFVRETRYEYFRCPNRDGLFIAFFHFLRSQGLIRGLTDAELDELKRHAQTMSCANCGAPIALERETACAHCGTAISTIDVDYLGAALRQLDEDARTRTSPMPAGGRAVSREAATLAAALAVSSSEDWPDDRNLEVSLVEIGTSALGKVFGW